MKASALLISRYIGCLRSGIIEANEACPVILNAYCDVNLAELATRQLLAEKMENELKMSASQQETFLKDFSWLLLKQEMERKLVETTVSASIVSISSVNEVPRLFRRTNRGVPTKRSDYVENILAPIAALKTDVLNIHLGDLWESVGPKISSQVLLR